LSNRRKHKPERCFEGTIQKKNTFKDNTIEDSLRLRMSMTTTQREHTFGVCGQRKGCVRTGSYS
jgi:hypothetical protein